ncbi:MAG: carboxypeptidase regulatory-like domain-containing protein [Candidatus Methylomirabilales bacterium]
MGQTLRVVTLGFLGLLLMGPSPTRAYQEGPVERGGTLTGTVRFQGPIPEPYIIWVTKDEEVFGKAVPDERLLISKQGRVKNVVITIEGIQRGKPWPNLKPRLINEKGRFIPHVQVAMRGTRLEIVNRDPVLHNTHGFQGGRSLFNRALPRFLRGRPVFQPLPEAGLLEVMCDVHDWMNGWVIVLEHPYFAITGEDGTYAITEIPPGTYKVTAWHEKLGKKETQVTVKGTGGYKLDLTFSP